MKPKTPMYEPWVKSSDDLCTPPHVLDLVRGLLGVDQVDLDPCSNSHSLVNARKSIALPKNGLRADWDKYDSVFVNPPYSDPSPWIAKAVESCTPCALLLPVCTDTEWGQDALSLSSAIFFLRGRLRFIGGKSTARFPSMLCFTHASPTLLEFDVDGWYVCEISENIFTAEYVK